MFLSEDIDLDYERDRERRIKKIIKDNNCIEAELNFVFAEDIDNTTDSGRNTSIQSTQLEPNSNLSLSMTRSGVYRVTYATRTIGIQTDLYSVLQPPVRKVKICTEEIKSALANVSVAAEIYPEKARLAAQAFAKTFYGHNYYLNPSEKHTNYETKKTRTADDNDFYSDTFPDKKV